MKSECLYATLNRLSPSQTCLIIDGVHISIGETLARALALRSSLSEARGARIALYGLAPFDLIMTIIALDGYAAQMLLLPPSLDTVTLDSLSYRAGTTHVLLNGVHQCYPYHQVNPNITDKGSNQPTKWILATSGTTGTPKLIEHRLATLTRTVRTNSERGADFVWGLLYDPNRYAGLQVVLQALFSGSALVVPKRVQFDAQLDALLANPVNALSATPTLWRKLLMEGRLTKIALRQLTLGGETADQAILDALKKQFPLARIVHIYASTEAGTGFAVKDGRQGFPKGWLDDPEQSPSLRINSANHLLIKPALLPGGPEIITRLDSDGYLDTQDLVHVEGDRVLFMGRELGAINVGGNKVSPELLESYLRGLDGVIDAHVYGKKSSMMGQLVATEIVPTAQADLKKLRKHIIQCCKKDLENWMIPALITFKCVLQENSAGKRERVKV